MVRRRVRRNKSSVSKSYDFLNDKSSELSTTLQHAKKRYGGNTVRVASDVKQPDRISTGVFVLDFSLLGGIPFNRTSMIVGEKHAGKSMLAMKIIANAQRMMPDKTPVIIDVEGTFDSVWAKQLGVDISNLPISECEVGEMAVDMAEAVVSSYETSLLVVDSLAALTPMKEAEGSAEDAHVGLQARMVGSMMRRVTSALIRERKRGHYVTVLYINQFRSKIGVTYGDPRTIPGGRALEYATTVQMIIKNKEQKGKNAYGVETMTSNEHSFTITKNKMNNGPRSGEFMLVREPMDGLAPGEIDDNKTIISFAKKFGIYSGGGGKYRLAFDDYDITVGKADALVDMMREDPDLKWDLRSYLIREQAANLGMDDSFLDSIGNREIYSE